MSKCLTNTQFFSPHQYLQSATKEIFHPRERERKVDGRVALLCNRVLDSTILSSKTLIYNLQWTHNEKGLREIDR